MRDKEGRKKEASKAMQTTKQSNTTHPRQSLFQRRMSCLGWDSNPRHSIHPLDIRSALPAELPNLTSHSIHLMNRLTIRLHVQYTCTIYMYMVLCVQVVMEYVGGGSISNLLRNPDTGPVRGEVRKREHYCTLAVTLAH